MFITPHSVIGFIMLCEIISIVDMTNLLDVIIVTHCIISFVRLHLSQ